MFVTQSTCIYGDEYACHNIHALLHVLKSKLDFQVTLIRLINNCFCLLDLKGKLLHGENLSLLARIKNDF